MYKWREMTEAERTDALRERIGRGLPWHRPPHRDFVGPATFIITGACYEHRHVIGSSVQRMAEFEGEILQACKAAGGQTFAWCILPNHYHLLTRAEEISLLRKAIGKVHGRTATLWNRMDKKAGRKVWFNFFDREIRSERHYWATKNYIHNNPVHHGYVKKWQGWPFSSVHQYLEAIGRDEASRIWREYPVLDYGKGWDDY